jgi:hypothetical protein
VQLVDACAAGAGRGEGNWCQTAARSAKPMPTRSGLLYAAVVGASVGAIMEMASPSAADRVLLLGPLQVIQNGAQRSLPPSRKVRALLAYLAMAPRPVTREKLCELFWDVADDPRSELRWCLCKLRPLVDAPTTTRLIADRERVEIDTNALDIDAIALARSAQTTLTGGSPRDLPRRVSRGPLPRPGCAVRQLARGPKAPLRSIEATAPRATQRRLAAGER